MVRRVSIAMLLVLGSPAVAQDEADIPVPADADEGTDTAAEEPMLVLDPAPFVFGTGGSIQRAPLFTTLGLDANLRAKLHRRVSVLVQGSAEVLPIWTRRDLAFDGETVVPLEAVRSGAGLVYRLRRELQSSDASLYIDLAVLGGASVLAWQRLEDPETRGRSVDGTTVAPNASLQLRVGVPDGRRRYNVIAPTITWTRGAGVSVRLTVGSDSTVGRRRSRAASRGDTRPLAVPVFAPFGG